jgi:apolipoprotein N-acyltransferase
MIVYILSGIFLSLSFYSSYFSLLTWISFVPIFFSILINKDNPIKFFIFGLSFYLGLMTWLFKLYPMSFLGIKPIESILLLSIGWFSFSFIESLIYLVFGFLFYKINFHSTENRAISFIPLFLLVEWLQGKTDAGLTWGRLAISQYENLSLIQSSNISGTLLVDAFILSINLFIAIILVNYFNKDINIRIKRYTIIPIILFINILYGYYSIYLTDPNQKTVKIGIVQGNISSSEKWSTPYNKILDIYKDITTKMINANGKPDVILWPESVAPMPISENYIKSEPIMYNSLKSISITNKSYLITGILTTSTNFEDFYKGLNNIKNSTISIDPQGNFSDFYSKRHLVPFGEYLPFGDILRKIIPKLGELNALKHDVVQGEKIGIFETKFGKIGSIICYESIFPEIVSSNIKLGAELIAISTNDSWFKDSSAVYQHNGQAVLRAIENDRFIIRAANTGISSIIDNKGNIIDSIPPLESGYIFDKVSFIKTRTLYSYIGDIPIVLFSLLSIFFLSKKRNTKIL